MDCLICFKIFVKEREYENISFPNGDICARSICKLLEIQNSPRIQEIFQDPVICSKCYQILKDVHKVLVQLEEIQRKIYGIRADIQKDLDNSKNISQVMQDAYGGKMSKSSKDRLELFKLIKRPSEENSSNILKMNALQDIYIDIQTDQSTTLPLSPNIPDQTTRNELNPHTNILSEMEIDKIKSSPDSIKGETSTSKDQQFEFLKRRKHSEMIKRTRKSKYSMYFYCKICKTKFSSRSSLSKHMRKHIPGKERQIKLEESFEDFICSECGKPHHSETELQTHLDSALTSTNIQKCSLCPEEYWGDPCLQFHQKNSHHSSPKNESKDNKELGSSFECMECGIKFGRPSSLYNHRLIHGQKKFKCSFDGCEKKFYQKGGLKSHINNVHKRKMETNLECQFCLIKFTEKESLRNHRNTDHTDQKRSMYQCQFCSRKFWKKSYLSKHLRDEKPSECTICHESFKSVGCLKHHYSIIHGMNYTGRNNSKTTQFKCKICKNFYSTNSALKYHRAVHEDPKFKCPENDCEKMFRYKHGMLKHLEMFHKKLI